MPRDLLAGPRDLLADAEPPEPGVMAQVGDLLVDTLGGASATMRDNARTGDFARDAAQNETFLDRAGSLIERGAASVDRGLYSFLGGFGSQRAREEAANLAQGTLAKPVTGSTAWADVHNPGDLGKFIGSAGIESLPAMGALAVPWAGPALVGTSQTGNIAAERAANNNTELTGDDLLAAAPYAVASTALDKFGLKGITKPMAGTVAGRVAGATAREGLTEAAQSGIEYTGGTVGTEKGFEPVDLLSNMVQGGVAGAGIGGSVRGGIEAASPVTSRLIKSKPVDRLMLPTITKARSMIYWRPSPKTYLPCRALRWCGRPMLREPSRRASTPRLTVTWPGPARLKAAGTTRRRIPDPRQMAATSSPTTPGSNTTSGSMAVTA